MVLAGRILVKVQLNKMTSSANSDQIKELLGSGLSNDVVASVVGVTPSYISQLLSDAAFSEEVLALRVISLTANTTRDRSLDSLEDKLIAKAHEIVDSSQIYKPLDVVRTLIAVNGMKRRGVPVKETIPASTVTVNLVLPRKVVNQFTITPQGEVIEAEGQTLVTMPATTLLKQLSESHSNTEKQNATDSPATADKYREIQKYLPSAKAASSR